jgi:hypothetical protein
MDLILIDWIDPVPATVDPPSLIPGRRLDPGLGIGLGPFPFLGIAKPATLAISAIPGKSSNGGCHKISAPAFA